RTMAMGQRPVLIDMYRSWRAMMSWVVFMKARIVPKSHHHPCPNPAPTSALAMKKPLASEPPGALPSTGMCES
ncbi:MAG: hypothetical protein WD534_18670, partial [Phycisphaeraceae bacterium]